MANTVFQDIPAFFVAKNTASFSSLGIDSTKVAKIIEAPTVSGGAFKSFDPSRSINSINPAQFTATKGYMIFPKLSMDLSTIVDAQFNSSVPLTFIQRHGTIVESPNGTFAIHAEAYMEANQSIPDEGEVELTNVAYGTTLSLDTSPVFNPLYEPGGVFEDLVNGWGPYIFTNTEGIWVGEIGALIHVGTTVSDYVEGDIVGLRRTKNVDNTYTIKGYKKRGGVETIVHTFTGTQAANTSAFVKTFGLYDTTIFSAATIRV